MIACYEITMKHVRAYIVDERAREIVDAVLNDMSRIDVTSWRAEFSGTIAVLTIYAPWSEDIGPVLDVLHANHIYAVSSHSLDWQYPTACALLEAWGYL